MRKEKEESLKRKKIFRSIRHFAPEDCLEFASCVVLNGKQALLNQTLHFVKVFEIQSDSDENADRKGVIQAYQENGRRKLTIRAIS